MPKKFSDAELADFIDRLDSSDISLTDWEARFVGSNTDRNRFSDKQKEVIQQLIEKYRDQLKW